ncbi:Isoamyl acetate-hydrolyzing esterase 1 homolog [Rhizoctonia solani AG-1 IB]|uniref:Isoamyl acetate-hydrolyzing esterase 1 homolog n=1 Tax=Thanatephorus cucumeris (strain AG1-IB / isolate 7/3/14) TaxID=1108050 RepID=M5BHU2_THACB|nr:Isoamyl acetate-hydrolyzing esterase 1 homolog [Rhizoctonia solani AG-1 IB]
MAANSLDCIMLLGDSLTQGGWEPRGFAQQLAYAYARKLDVINRGLSGYNTEWAIPIFEKCFAKSEVQSLVPKVKLLVIWFGANDACLEQSPQHVPLSKFAENINKLVNMPTSPSSPWYSPRTRVILVTAPPVNATQRGGELASRNPPLAPDRTHETTKSYAQAVIDAGDKLGVPVVDLWTALWKEAGETEQGLESLLPDGIHCNERSYSILYNLLIEAILKHYPELHFDQLPKVYPAWDQIDWKNPGPSLISHRIDV